MSHEHQYHQHHHHHHQQQQLHSHHPPSTFNGGMAAAWAEESNTAQQIPSAVVDTEKQTHPEWGVMKDQEFHPLTLKHQRDLENLHQAGNLIPDFYFWQANLGGYCMADMIQNIVVSPETAFILVRRIVEGAPHPGRRKKKRE